MDVGGTHRRQEEATRRQRVPSRKPKTGLVNPTQVITELGLGKPLIPSEIFSELTLPMVSLIRACNMSVKPSKSMVFGNS